jgi:hypothetical protein
MTVVKRDRPAERAPDGRWLPGVIPHGARPWKPGTSANPGGKGGLYHEMQRLAREFTPEATGYLIGIARDEEEDTRNRIVAMSMLYERAWGKPKEYDPSADREPETGLDFSLLSPEQRRQLREILELAAVRNAETDR